MSDIPHSAGHRRLPCNSGQLPLLYNSSRRRLLAIIGWASLAAALTTSSAWAFETTSSKPLNVDAGGLALRGYDPVAYFTLGKPTLGDAAFEANHDGGSYRFANAAHKAAFIAEPAKYLPAYGGFCALGTSFEKKFDGDPLLWKIVDGKLYLNVSTAAATRWGSDIAGFIGTANTKWPTIKDKAPKDL